MMRRLIAPMVGRRYRWQTPQERFEASERWFRDHEHGLTLTEMDVALDAAIADRTDWWTEAQR